VRVLLVAAALLCLASSAEAANRYVCAGAGGTVNNDCGVGLSGDPDYATIQAAVTAAGSGDVIFIVPGTYNETVTLPNKGALASPIIIRGSRADSLYPPTGVRLCPDVRADASTLQCSPNVAVADLPTIVGVDSSTNSRGFQTAAGAQDYIIRFLRFTSNTLTRGQNEMIQLGSNDPTQDLYTEQPQDITVDRVFFEANHLVGQKVGVSLNGMNLRVENSYFANMVGVGQDAACYAGYNGLGPVYFINNYCEGGGYGGIIGGSDPAMRTTVNTTTGSTTTVLNYDPATFSAGDSETAHSIGTSMTALVGKTIAVAISATAREHRTVTAVDATANTITVSPALSTAPATGLPIDWGAVYQGGNIERNWFYNPTRWMNAIIPAPASVSASDSNAAGTLAIGAYSYIVAARNHDSYQGADITSPNSQPVTCTLDAVGQCVISWSAVPGATHYRVYAVGRSVYFQVTAPTVTFTDTGAAGTAGTPPGSTGTRWTIKTHVEFKQGNDFFVRYNRLTNKWYGQGGGGAGRGMWLKSVNQSGAAPFMQTKNLTVSYNVIEHVSACFLTQSQEEYEAGSYARPAPLENLLIEHNLCYDSGSQYGDTSFAFNSGYTQGLNPTVRNNTIMHTSRGVWAPDGAAMQGTFTFSANLAYHNSYGFLGSGSTPGTPTLDLYMPTRTFSNNVLAGAGSNPYPATTLKPTTAEFEAAFVNPNGTNITDFDLVAGHAYRTAGTGGTRLGADIPTLATFLAGVQAGTASGAPAWVTNSPLPSGVSGVAYTTTVVATGGTGGKTYSLIGSLPPGLSLTGATGVISGTPTGGANTYTFSLRATDQSANSSDRQFSITINVAGGAVTITTTSVPNADANVAYTAALNATGGTGTKAWSLSSGTLPPGLTIGTSTGLITGTPTTPGNYNFTVRVDIGGSFDTQDLSIRVSNVGPDKPLPFVPRPDVWNGQAIWTHATETAPTVESNRVRPKDLWIAPDYTVHVVTGTSPTVTTAPIASGSTHVFINASDTRVASNVPDNGESLSGRNSVLIDLRHYNQARLFFYLFTYTGPVAGTKVRLEYSIDNQATWHPIDGDGQVGTEVDITTGMSTYKTTGWVTIAEVARTANAWLRCYITDGDGVADPGFGVVAAELRKQ